MEKVKSRTTRSKPKISRRETQQGGYPIVHHTGTQAISQPLYVLSVPAAGITPAEAAVAAASSARGTSCIAVGSSNTTQHVCQERQMNN
eukprot:5724815-Amphidinium_carterae.1